MNDSMMSAGVWATLMTVAIATLGLLIGFWKQAQEQGAQRQRMEQDHKSLNAAHDKLREMTNHQSEIQTEYRLVEEKLNAILTAIAELKVDFKTHLTDHKDGKT